MGKLSIKIAFTEDEYLEFYNIYTDAFKNEPDEIFSKEEVLKWIDETEDYANTKIFLLLKDNITVGFAILMHKDGIGNIPWAGIKSQYQGHGLYSQFINLMIDTIFNELNINILTRECDNPEVLEGNVKKFAIKRLSMFREKLNSKFYNNNEFVYFREDPKSPNERTYKYLFGFTLLKPNSNWEITNNKVSKKDFKKLVQYRIFFERGIFEIEKQLQSNPVVKDLYQEIDNLKEEYLTIE